MWTIWNTKSQLLLKQIEHYNYVCLFLCFFIMQTLTSLSFDHPNSLSFKHVELCVMSFQKQLYVGSEVGVVQLSISECGRYRTCLDCVLARDPHCGWDLNTERCATINSIHRTRSRWKDEHNKTSFNIIYFYVKPKIRR